MGLFSGGGGGFKGVVSSAVSSTRSAVDKVVSVIKPDLATTSQIQQLQTPESSDSKPKLIPDQYLKYLIVGVPIILGLLFLRR